MVENFCGKNCDNCESFEKGTCPGCKDGPGKSGEGKCPVANCCRTSGFGKCENCYKANFCSKLAQIKDDDSEEEVLEESDQEKTPEEKGDFSQYIGYKKSSLSASTIHRDYFYAKYINIIFWTYIAILIVDTIDKSFENFLGISGFITLISLGLSITQIVVYLKMGEREKMFYNLAIVTIASAIFTFLLTIFSALLLSVGLLIVTLILIMVTGLYCVYAECTGYANILRYVNPSLSLSWKKLTIALMIAPIFSAVIGIFTFLSPSAFGVILTIIGTIITLVLGIIKLVCLHSTVESFK